MTDFRLLTDPSPEAALTRPVTRRQFMKQSTLLAMSAAIGAHLPFGRFLPEGLSPVALAETPDLQLYGKHAGLMVLGDSPFGPATLRHRGKLSQEGLLRDQGRAQPMVVPGWSAGDYGSNACHRVAVRVV